MAKAKGIPNHKSKTMLMADWKKRCQAHADEIGVVSGDDLWDANDSFSLIEEADKAWANGEEPDVFVERMFAEDLASAQNDDEMAQRSIEEGEEDEEDQP